MATAVAFGRMSGGALLRFRSSIRDLRCRAVAGDRVNLRCGCRTALSEQWGACGLPVQASRLQPSPRTRADRRNLRRPNACDVAAERPARRAWSSRWRWSRVHRGRLGRDTISRTPTSARRCRDPVGQHAGQRPPPSSRRSPRRRSAVVAASRPAERRLGREPEAARAPGRPVAMSFALAQDGVRGPSRHSFNASAGCRRSNRHRAGTRRRQVSCGRRPARCAPRHRPGRQWHGDLARQVIAAAAEPDLKVSTQPIAEQLDMPCAATSTSAPWLIERDAAKIAVAVARPQAPGADFAGADAVRRSSAARPGLIRAGDYDPGACRRRPTSA